jgi:hypothetical protein
MPAAPRGSFRGRAAVLSLRYGAMRLNTSPLFEIALVLVRLDHVARVIVNANHGIV